MGALVPESAQALRLHTEIALKQALESVQEDDRKQVDFLVIGADTKLETPIPEIRSEHKRAVETAELILDAIQATMKEYQLDLSQLLNKTGRPIELSSGRLRDLRMFEDCPKFVSFLKEKYGTGIEFWEAYEDDLEKETREKMGAEGPDEIARRTHDYLRVVTNAMKSYHSLHPGRRVMVWVEGHYDNLSPYLKQATGMKRTDYLPIDHGAVVAIHVARDQKVTAQIQGLSYDLSLA